MIPELFQINRRVEEYPGVFTLYLSPEEAHRELYFTPGQFNMLYAFGAGEVPISMSGTSSEHAGYVHTIRVHGLITQALAHLHEGEVVGVRGPFGTDWPLTKIAGKQVLIIAGGLGLAPLRPAINALLFSESGAVVEQIFYGARSPRELLYREEIDLWSQRTEVKVTVDHAERDWTGDIGVITGPLAAASITVEQTVAFICGPEIMMRYCIRELLNKGLPPSAIYISMERNMKCATGHCGHCQWGPNFICKEGPVFCYEDIQQWFHIRAL